MPRAWQESWAQSHSLEQWVDLTTTMYHWDLDLCVYSHFYVNTSVLNADQFSLKRTGMIKFPLYWWVNWSHRKTSWFVHLASQDGIRDSQFPVCCSSDWWSLFPFPSSNVYPKPIKNTPSIPYSKLEQTVLIWPQLWSYKFNLQGHLYGRRSSVKIQESMQGENRRGMDNITPIKCLHMWFVWKQLLWDQKEICCFWQNW